MLNSHVIFMLKGSPGILYGHSLSHYWECTQFASSQNLGSNWARKMAKYFLESAGPPLEGYIGRIVQQIAQKNWKWKLLWYA